MSHLQTYQVSPIRRETRAFGLYLTLTRRTATIFSRIGARPGIFFKITTMHCQIVCVQKKQSTKFAQSSDCTQFVRIINLTCRTNRAQICRLRTLLLSKQVQRKFGRAQNGYCAQVCPDSFRKFIQCAPLDTTGRSSERRILDIIFSRFIYSFGGNNLIQSYFHVNQQYLLCTSCEF